MLVESETITVQVTECENQKAIAKVGIADCGIVTVQTYQGLDVLVKHTKNLNQGDDCCEVVISKEPHPSR